MIRKKRFFIISLAIVFLFAILGIVFSMDFDCSQKSVGEHKLEEVSNIFEDDNLLIWNEVNGAVSYIVKINETEYDVTKNELSLEGYKPGQYNILIIAKSDRGVKFDSSTEYVLNFGYRGIIIKGKNISVFKDYDGTRQSLEKIRKGVHYEIKGLKYGEDVDIVIQSMEYNSKDVKDTQKIIVRYGEQLVGNDASNYRIKSGRFEIKGEIKPKSIDIIPQKIVKQFGDADSMKESIMINNEKIDCVFSRTEGEDIGIYDIIAVSIDSPNYIPRFDLILGKGKFQVIPRVLNVRANNVVFRKTYDGTNYFDSSEIKKGKHYTIEKTMQSYQVDITILSAEYNSPSVNTAQSLTVKYSTILKDSNSVYEISASEIVFVAEILPKEIYVLPNRFVKQFGDADCFTQNVSDDETVIEIGFERERGENVGSYDIVGVNSSNSDYSAKLIANSGKRKVEIIKRVISVVPINEETLIKVFDNKTQYFGELEKDKHYSIQNIISGYSANIRITNIQFDSAIVGEMFATAYYESVLEFGGQHYEVVRGSFILNAKIVKKKIAVEPVIYSKQYGDSDILVGTYFDSELDLAVEYTYIRDAGETVGIYSIVSAQSHLISYEIDVINGASKFRIAKRIIYVEATSTISKIFDNTYAYNKKLIENIDYIVMNCVNGDLVNIIFSNIIFSDKTTTATRLTADIVVVSDKYELRETVLVFSANITKKAIQIEPKSRKVQYGDADNLAEVYQDAALGLTIDLLYEKSVGAKIGIYDLLSASTENLNYAFAVVGGQGVGKYEITPRKLNVKIVDGVIFTKHYDGTTNCGIPIFQESHYTLENLIGGSEVSLKIVSKNYNSKDVLMATKITIIYSAILSGSDGTNYELTEGSFEFPASISLREIDIEPSKFVKKYGETESLVQSYYDELTSETISAYFHRQIGEDVKKYNITSAISKNSNFVFRMANGTEKFEIVKNNIGITAYDKTSRYSKSSQEIDTPYSLPNKELIVEYRLEGKESFDMQLPVNAGEYEVRISFIGDECYNAAVIYKSFKIERVESFITSLTPSSVVYNGLQHRIIAELNHSEVQLAFSNSYFVNAGKYENILISAPQSLNYKASSVVISINIEKYAVSDEEIIFPTPAPITYGQYLSEASLLGHNAYGHFSWQNGNVVPMVNNEGFSVQFTPYDRLNYDWSNVTMQNVVYVVVNKAKVSIIPPLAKKINFGDKLKSATLQCDTTYGGFAWQNEEVIPLENKNYYSAVFTPFDTENYDWSDMPTICRVLVEVYFPIRLNTLGGSAMTDVLVDVLYEPPIPQRKGYVFEGWHFDSEFKSPVVYPYSVNAPTMFYALWRVRGLQFEYDFSENGYIVFSDGEPIQSLAIPNTYKGKEVFAIKRDAFAYNYQLRSLIIPSSITTIGDRAVYGCINLIEIHICSGIESLNLGEDWNKTLSSVPVDIHFDCRSCVYCQGSYDCHVDCPYCLYCGSINGEHSTCSSCGNVCMGMEQLRFCIDCGKCADCVKVCFGCGRCENCNINMDKLVCSGCHWCNSCNRQNGFEYCYECGKCNACFNYCAICGNCITHCSCTGVARVYFVRPNIQVEWSKGIYVQQ